MVQDDFEEKGSLNLLKGGISVVTVNSTKMLRFKDTETFFNVLKSLNNVGVEERIQFTKSLGIKSYTEYLFDAMAESSDLQNIKDVVSIREKFEKIKKNYSPILMFNEKEDDDFIPYSKIKNFEVEAVVNGNGKYMIGNKVMTANFYSSFDEYYGKVLIGRSVENSMVTRGHDGQSHYTNSINTAWSRTSNRYASVVLSMSENRMFMRLNAQRKTWLGWFVYSTVYELEYFFPVSPYYSFLFNESEAMGSPYLHYVDVSGIPLKFHTVELSNGFSVELGIIVKKATPPGPPHLPTEINGVVYVWSRGIEFKDRGSAGIVFPYPKVIL